MIIIDPATDGPEVEAIRRELMVARGRFLFWRDVNGKVLPRPMVIEEIMEREHV